jgi:hypothetical protein
MMAFQNQICKKIVVKQYHFLSFLDGLRIDFVAEGLKQMGNFASSR